MSSLIRIATVNIFETATSLTDNGDAIAGYPLDRIRDRDCTKLYQNYVTNCGITASGGISAMAADALIIGAGHSLAGQSWSHNSGLNGTDWTARASGVGPAGTGVICAEFASVAAAYWYFYVAGIMTHQLSELFLTSIYTFPYHADRASSEPGLRLNVKSEETSAGSERWIEYGAARRTWRYEFPAVPATMADTVAAMINALGGVKPFYLCDHTGTWIWGNATDPVVAREITSLTGEKSFTLNFREAI